MPVKKDYPDLDKAFYGGGGDDLRRWLIVNGHINEDLQDDPKMVIEYEFALRLFNDADFGVLPIAIKEDDEEKPEVNVVDKILEERENE